MSTLTTRLSMLSLLLLLGVCPAGAVLFHPSPSAVTAGAATVTVDILRQNEPGDVGGFSEDELDTFEWFAPNVPFLTGTPLRLPRPTLIRDNLIRLQLDAARLTVPGIATIVYTANTTGARVRQVITLYINRPPQIDGALAAGAVNTRMAQTLEALQGTGPYRWSIAAGSLPPGVALVGRAQFADFLGAPTTAGSYPFTLRVDDGFGISAEKQFTLAIAAPPGPALLISTATLPAAAVGVPYLVPLQASGGTTPYQWSNSGTLPPGLAVLPGGFLSGTPTAAGTYSIAVRVQDAAGRSDQKTFSLVIDAPGQFRSVNAASFEAGVSADHSIVSGFGENLAAALVSSADRNLPESLAGVSVVIRDVGGREVAAPLFFVSPRQINYLIPLAVPRPGPAVVTVRSAGRIIASGPLQIEIGAPGIFTANADGKGVAAAIYVRGAGPSRTTGPVFLCDATPGSCRPDPIDLGPSDGVFLTLFGTGVRARSALSAVTATIGGESVPVSYAGAQNEFPGLDQINLGPLPRSLAGRGTVTVLIKVDGKDANPVSIAFR